MPTFPYHYKEIEYGRVFNPVVLLPIKTAWGWQNLWFLVDSGADTVMLPAALAKKLDLPFDKAAKTKLYGIGRQAVLASPARVVFKINGLEISVRSYFVYSPDSILLLGRLDVFEKFSVTFNRREQKIIFT